MSDSIFLLQENGQLTRMANAAYNSERILQQLLIDYPDLLTGDQIDPDQPRRWLLITDEMPISDDQDGADRWALDHLFLDQDGIPTLVEVKRSSDTRIRREVVGQMLDYAANAVAYMPVEQLQASFESTCYKKNVFSQDVLREFLSLEKDVGSFWMTVKTNLEAGRIRLLFVADVIPRELQRVVEFLNRQMNPAEILAVEIKQYVGEGALKTLVPRVFGHSIESTRKHTITALATKISKDEFLKEIEVKYGETALSTASAFVDWCRQKGMEDNFKRNPGSVSYIPPVITSDDKRCYSFAVSTHSEVQFRFVSLVNFPPFTQPEKLKELEQRILAVPGLTQPKNMRGYCTTPFSAFSNPATMKSFLDILGWIVNELRASPNEPSPQT